MKEWNEKRKQQQNKTIANQNNRTNGGLSIAPPAFSFSSKSIQKKNKNLGEGVQTKMENSSSRKGRQLPDHLIDSDGNKLDINVEDNQLVYGDNVSEEVRATLNAMWQTEEGKEQVNHLLKSKAGIELDVSENVGAYIVDGKYYAVYGSTGPAPDQDKKLIKDYDGGKVYSENTVTLFKGTYGYGTGDNTQLEEGKVTVIDPATGEDVSAKHQGKVNLEPSQNPDKIYKSATEFYNLTGTHEAEHTKSDNIKLQRRGKDAEAPAYKIEDESKKRLKKIIHEE